MFHQLDITDTHSIANLKKFIQEKYGGLDILVNNAGIAYKVIKLWTIWLYNILNTSFLQGNATEPFAEQARVTMATNFTATVNVCNSLFPLLRPGARFVHNYWYARLKEIKPTVYKFSFITGLFICPAEFQPCRLRSAPKRFSRSSAEWRNYPMWRPKWRHLWSK